MTSPIIESTKRMFETLGASSAAAKTAAGTLAAVVAAVPVIISVDARYAKTEQEKAATAKLEQEIVRLQDKLDATRMDLAETLGLLNAALLKQQALQRYTAPRQSTPPASAPTPPAPASVDSLTEKALQLQQRVQQRASDK